MFFYVERTRPVRSGTTPKYKIPQIGDLIISQLSLSTLLLGFRRTVSLPSLDFIDRDQGRDENDLHILKRGQTKE